MEAYKAVKRIESFPPEELVVFLSRFELTECRRMIIEEEINGEEFLNITEEKMDPYLNKTEQDHLLMMRTYILENPIESLKKYDDRSSSSQLENDEHIYMNSEVVKQANVAATYDSLSKGMMRNDAVTKPVVPNKPTRLLKISPALTKYSELSTNEQFYNVDHNEGVKILKNRQTGAYVIRPSRSETCYCTLMIKTEKDIVNVQIAKKEDKYYLYSADKYSEICFKDMSSLLAHFTINTMPLPVAGVLLCDNKSKHQRGTFYLP